MSAEPHLRIPLRKTSLDVNFLLQFSPLSEINVYICSVNTKIPARDLLCLRKKNVKIAPLSYMNLEENLSKDNLPNQPLRFEVDGIDYSAITENTSMVNRDDYGHLTSIDIPASVEFDRTTYE